MRIKILKTNGRILNYIFVQSVTSNKIFKIFEPLDPYIWSETSKDSKI